MQRLGWAHRRGIHRIIIHIIEFMATQYIIINVVRFKFQEFWLGGATHRSSLIGWMHIKVQVKREGGESLSQTPRHTQTCTPHDDSTHSNNKLSQTSQSSIFHFSGEGEGEGIPEITWETWGQAFASPAISKPITQTLISHSALGFWLLAFAIAISSKYGEAAKAWWPASATIITLLALLLLSFFAFGDHFRGALRRYVSILLSPPTSNFRLNLFTFCFYYFANFVLVECWG